MPQVSIENASGPSLVSYTIATPQSNDAESIDSSLPTIILLHPIYMSQVIFHYQFACPDLRRFNLIALDARCHGRTVGAVPQTYRRRDAAEDVICFMEALNLPPCHFLGVSFGACIALDIAVFHPKKVLSLLLLSPIPLVEPELVAAGRQEIYDCWVEGHKNPDNPNEEASRDAVFGTLQLGFNHNASSFVNAIVEYNAPQVIQIWSKEHFDEFHTISIVFFLNRDPHPISCLKNIGCPVHLVHCEQDIAYPITFAEEIQDRMKQAGVNVRLSQIPDAPHVGCVTHPESVNKLFYAWLLEVIGGASIPPVKISVMSPYQAELVTRCGLRTGEELSDSDDDFIVAS